MGPSRMLVLPVSPLYHRPEGYPQRRPYLGKIVSFCSVPVCVCVCFVVAVDCLFDLWFPMAASKMRTLVPYLSNRHGFWMVFGGLSILKDPSLPCKTDSRNELHLGFPFRCPGL